MSYLNEPITTLDCIGQKSTIQRIHRTLHGMNVYTYGDLFNIDVKDLRNQPYFGRKSFLVFEKALDEKGLCIIGSRITEKPSMPIIDLMEENDFFRKLLIESKFGLDALIDTIDILNKDAEDIEKKELNGISSELKKLVEEIDNAIGEKKWDKG